MSVFTKVNTFFLQHVSKNYNTLFQNVSEISTGLDNSVYLLINNKEQKYIMKIFEGKKKRRIKEIISLYNYLNNEGFLQHNYIANNAGIQFSCFNKHYYGLLNYVSHDNKYTDIKLLLDKVMDLEKLFSQYYSYNKTLYTGTPIILLNSFLNETIIYYRHIKENCNYLKEYTNFNIDQLYNYFISHYDLFKNTLLGSIISFIHNDIMQNNVVNNHKNGVEIIDFDGFNENFIIKEYIIIVIRFNLFNKLGHFFEKKHIDGVLVFNIGGTFLSFDHIILLSKIYIINILFNMIYYIGCNKKNITDKNFKKGCLNQHRYELYKLYLSL